MGGKRTEGKIVRLTASGISNRERHFFSLWLEIVLKKLYDFRAVTSAEPNQCVCNLTHLLSF